jgi:adenylylsulfate kinase
MKSPNIFYHNATVTRERRKQYNGHKSVIIWFTGFSGSGKSTLSHSFEESVAKVISFLKSKRVIDGT